MSNYLRRSARNKSYSKVRIKGQAMPKLPHERDERAAGSTDATPAPEMRKAARDLKRGLVDTDKGPVMEPAYQRQRAR